MLSYPAAAALTAAVVVLCATWLHRSACASSRGSPAATAVAVSLLMNLAVVLLYDGATAYVTRGMLAFLLTWLASSKAVAFLCCRGPLAAQRWTRAQFVVLYALPLLPADPQAAREASGDGGSLLARSAAKMALTAVALFGLACGPPQVVREVLYVTAMYGWLGFAMDGLGSLALTWLGLHLEPHFRPPWQARSLSALWGRHWNLAASDAVRRAVYEPILEGAWVRQRRPGGMGPAAAPAEVAEKAAAAQRRGQRGTGGRPPRAAMALCAACLTSGLVHEAIVWYISGTTTQGAWLAFFALQGPLILAERQALNWLGEAGLKPPAPLRVALTLSTLLLVAHFLFFVPVERIPLIHQFVARMNQNFASVQAWLAPR